MKIYLWLFFVIVFQIVCFANETGQNCKLGGNGENHHNKAALDVNINKSSRIYLNTNDIYLEKDAIFVHVNSEWTKVNSLKADDKGLYVDNLWPFLYFICENCHTFNPSWRTYCIRCGLRRPD